MSILTVLVMYSGRRSPVAAAEEEQGFGYCKAGNGYCLTSDEFDEHIGQSAGYYCPLIQELACETCCFSPGDHCSHGWVTINNYDGEYGQCSS